MTQAVLVNSLSGVYAGESMMSFDGIESGINGKSRREYLEINSCDVQGDAQADPKHHGGVDRVLHHFPREHYGQYRRWDMITGFKDAPAMGENISTVGVDESMVHIGDIVQIGEVVLQVTQPRSPCFKLNKQFGHPEFALAMQTSSLCGWFYRVLQPGKIYPHDAMQLIERRSDISVKQAMAIYFSTEFDEAEYQRLLAAEGLAMSWRQSLAKRLDSRKIENWKIRLFGF